MSAHPASHRIACSALLLAALLLAPVAAAPGRAGNQTPEETSTMYLDSMGAFLDVAIMDSARGYLYFAGHDSENIQRLRLSDLSQDRMLHLDAGFHTLAAALDPSGDYAYFTTGNGDDTVGQIVRVSLAQGVISGTLPLASEDGIAVSAVADAAGDYVYFGTNTQPGKVIQVRRSDFTRTATLTLEAGEDDLRAAAIDGAAGYAYFGTNTSPGRIVRVRLTDFTRDGALTLGAGDDYLSCGVVDPVSGYAYFGTRTNPGRVVRLDLDGFVYSGTLTLSVGPMLHAILDGTANSEYVHFTTGAETAWIGNPSGFLVRVRQSGFTEVGSLPLTGSGAFEGGYVRAAAIDGGTAYLGAATFVCNTSLACWWLPGEMVRVDIENFEYIDRRRINEGAVLGVVLAGDYLYANAVSGQIVKIQPDTMTRVATANLPLENDALHRSLLDASGEHVFIARDISPMEVLKVRLSDLTVVDTLTLPTGENGSRSVTTDPQREFAYFGTGASQVVKVRLADLSRVDALDLGSIAYCGVIDPAAGMAYFGLGDGRVARVQLSDFTFLDTSPPFNSAIGACIVDSVGGYAYFAHGSDLTGAVYVERMALADFTHAGTLALAYAWQTGSKWPNEAVLDPDSGISYWTSWGMVSVPPHWGDVYFGGVDMVRLEDFTALEYVDRNVYPWSIQLDKSRNAAYFGIVSSPGAVQRLDLDPQADVSAHGTAAPIGIQSGQALTYTFTVTSMGPHAATGVTLTATLSFGLSFVSASPGCTPAGLLVHCALPDLRAAASRAVTVTVRADGPLPPEPFGATLQAGAQQPDGDPANNSAVVTATLVLPRAYLPVCGR